MGDFEPIISEDSNSPEVQADKEEARNIAAMLFESKKFCDVTFDVNGVEIVAHKSILSVRYKYFEAMFSRFEDTIQKKIVMQNVDPEVFTIVLEFVYKGQLSNWMHKMNEHAVALIKAADMYGIEGLRKKSEKYLIRAGKINLQTACDYFILADEHNAPQLKEAAFKFILSNVEEIKGTDGYAKFKRHRTSPAKLVEILSPSKRPKLSD